MFFKKEDFTELTIFQLLQNVWCYTDSIKNIERAKYWFWLPNYKNWCEEYFEEKWTPCLRRLKFVFKKINGLHPLYHPGGFDDKERHMEFFVRVKDIKRKIQNDVRRRSQDEM